MALIGAGNSLGGIAGSNAIARLLVVISGDTSSLEQALARAGGTMQSFSQNIGAIGSILTRTITLPFLAIGGAAIKSAADFNAALTRIAGLTPILDETGLSVEQLGQQLLDLASDPSVIATPTELADAYYFAGSAGLTAAESFQVVELSAQGASIGMGQAADIAKVLIFALNNFRSEGLTAAAAMDALTAAIREGTAEPDELAIALGRLLPIARQAGITFQEVVASVAALTNLGVPTRVATTSLRALFSQLLAPTIAATERLDEFGITAEQLRFQLQRGPIEAFQFLTEVTKGNEDALRTLIPQIRGLTAFYGLSTDEMSRYRDVLDSVNNSQGAFQQALDKFVQTPTFQFQKGLQEIQIAGIELGNQLIPIFIAISKVAQSLAQDFQDLPSPIKAAFAAFLVIGAVIGPMFQLIGALTQTAEATGRFGTVAGQTVPSVKALATGIATAGISAIVAFQSFNSLAKGSSSIITVVTGLVASFLAARLALGGLVTAANAGILGVNRLSIALAGISGAALTGITAGLALLATAVAFLAGRSAAARAKVEQFGEAMFNAAQSGDVMSQAIKNIEDEDLRRLVENWARAAEVLNQPVGTAIPATITQGSQAIAKAYQTLASADFEGKLGADQAAFRTWAAAAANAAATGGDIGKAVQAAGGDMGEFEDILGRVASQSLQFDEGIGGAAQTLQDASPAVQELTSTLNDYQDAQAAAIAAKVADQDAVANLADKYGVSTEFMNSKLQEFGTTAIGVMGENEDAFVQAAGGVDEFGNVIDLTMTEAAEAVKEQTANIKSALVGTFNLFEKPPNFNTKPIDEYIRRIQEWRDVSVASTQDVIELQQRGVPSSLIEQLAAEGPGMLRRFADATDSELRRIVTAYEIHLAAMDEEILAEGAHQEKKGAGLVEGFALAILKNRGLPANAAHQIIVRVGDEFNRGNLTPQGVRLATSFANGLRQAEGLTKGQAAKVANVFVTELQNRENFDNQGRLIILKVANGIAQATGLPKHQIALMLQGMRDNINANLEGFAGAGYRTAASFARGVASGHDAIRLAGAGMMLQLRVGIQSAASSVFETIATIGAQISARLDNALKGSPKYFTYYTGQELVKQMQEGINRISTPELRRPTLADGGPGSVYRGVGSRARNLNLDVDVKMDRRRLGREMYYESRFHGWE